MRVAWLVALAVSLPITARAQQTAPPSIRACGPAAPGLDPTDLLQRMGRAMGLPRVGQGILHLRMADATLEDYQSDRTYPPFFLGFSTREIWYRPATGVVRQAARI